MLKKHILLFPLLFIFLLQCTDRKLFVAELSESVNEIDSIIGVSKKISSSNPDSAIMLLEQLLQKPINVLSKSQESEAFLRLGVVYSIKNELDKSDSLYLKAISALKDEENICLLSSVYINLGINQSKRGNYPSSIDYYNKAKNNIEEGNDQCDLLGNIYNNLGLSYQYLGMIDSALNCHEKVIHYARERGNKLRIANALVNMCTVFHKYGEYEKIEPYLMEAKQLYEDLDDKNGVNNVCINLASVYSSMNEFDKALQLYEKADSITEILKIPRAKALIYHNLGNIYFKKKEYKESLIYAEKSLEIKKQYNDSIGMAYSYSALGAIYAKTGYYKDGKKYCLLSLEIAESKKNIELLSIVYDALLENQIFLGEKENVFETYSKKDVLRDSVFSKQKIEAVQGLQVKYETLQKEHEIKQLTERHKTQKIVTRLYISIFILLIAVALLIVIWLGSSRRKVERQVEYLKYRTVKSKFIPHFTGNVLNSISYLISENPKVAQQYISDFSAFTNRSLYSSDKLCHPLKDELDYAETYLILEKLRFEDDLNYIINVSPDVNLQMEIPTMIVHTFCENALKHGLRNKNGSGKIEISAYNKDGDTVVVVDDDGIGREKAKELKTEGNHEGLKIVDQQIKLYNKKNRNGAFLKIIDLYGSDNAPVGTRFELHIPNRL